MGSNMRSLVCIVTAGVLTSCLDGLDRGIYDKVDRFIGGFKASTNYVNPPPQFHKYYHRYNLAFTFGPTIGAILIAFVAGKVGRKPGIWKVGSSLIIFAAIFQPYALYLKSYEVFLFARFIVGIARGLNQGLGLLYLVEVSPTKYRGCMAMAFVLGQKVSYLIGFHMAEAFVTPYNWEWILISPTAFVLLQYAIFPFCPESPVVLRNMRRMSEANEVLENLGRRRVSAESVVDNSGATCFSFLINKLFQVPLLIALVLIISQACAFSHAFQIYRTAILLRLGISSTTIFLYLEVLGILAAVLSMDRFGGKFLMMVGLGGIASTQVLIYFCLKYQETMWVSQVGLVLFFLNKFFVGIGPGSVPWVVSAELFSDQARHLGVCMTYSFYWISTTVSVYNNIGHMVDESSSTFMWLVIITLGFLVFTMFILPETKCTPASEIQKMFK